MTTTYVHRIQIVNDLGKLSSLMNYLAQNAIAFSVAFEDVGVKAEYSRVAANVDISSDVLYLRRYCGAVLNHIASFNGVNIERHHVD